MVCVVIGVDWCGVGVDCFYFGVDCWDVVLV